jgi:hypothetical protein
VSYSLKAATHRAKLLVTLVKPLTNIFFPISRLFLNFARKLIYVAFGFQKIVIGHPGPLLLDLALKLIPFAFNLILIHKFTPILCNRLRIVAVCDLMTISNKRAAKKLYYELGGQRSRLRLEEGFSGSLKRSAAMPFLDHGKREGTSRYRNKLCCGRPESGPAPDRRAQTSGLPNALRTAVASCSIVNGFFTTISLASFPLMKVLST